MRAESQTTIGSILVSMGAITEEQLAVAVEEQLNSSVDVLIGKILVADGAISRERLEAALLVQQELRGKDKHRRALAQAKIAEQSTGALLDVSMKLRKEAREAKEKITGTEYPKIEKSMMSPGSDTNRKPSGA